MIRVNLLFILHMVTICCIDTKFHSIHVCIFQEDLYTRCVRDFIIVLISGAPYAPAPHLSDVLGQNTAPARMMELVLCLHWPRASLYDDLPWTTQNV